MMVETIFDGLGELFKKKPKLTREQEEELDKLERDAYFEQLKKEAKRRGEESAKYK
jgi:hypothetical protein